MNETIKELIINSDSLEKVAPEVLKFMYIEMIINNIVNAIVFIGVVIGMCYFIKKFKESLDC